MRSILKNKMSQWTVAFFALFLASNAIGEMHHHNKMEMNSSGEDVQVVDAWIMAPPGPNAAGYLTLTNKTDKPLKLLGVHSDAAVRVELHTHVHQDGVMKMIKMDDVIIDPNQSHTFAQGSDHVMFMGLKKPLESGQMVTVELRFEKHSPVTYQAKVLDMEEAARKTAVHSH